MKNGLDSLFTGKKTAGKTSAYFPGAYEERSTDEVNGDPHHEYAGDSPSMNGGHVEADALPTGASEEMKDKSGGNGRHVNVESQSNSKMPDKSSIAQKVRRIKNFVTFNDLPVRKKFLLFSAGSVFWVLIIAAIGLMTMFDMSSKSEQMVENIWPQEKTANIVIRKLRGANISIHNMAIFNDPVSIHSDYRRARETLRDSHTYLNTLLQGGQITDHMLATEQFSEPYRVLPVKDAERRETIEKVRSEIRELQVLTDEFFTTVSGKEARSAAAMGPRARNAMMEEISRYDNLTRDAVSILNDYSLSVSREWGKFTSQVKQRYYYAKLLISAVLGITLVLSVFFGVFIARSFAKPLNGIIMQIRALSSGEVDLTKKIDQTSQDELGILSGELNRLMDAIGHISTFKKIIEGDESSEDIYLRLGNIFRDELGIDDCIIYEVSNSKNTMDIAYPPGAQGLAMHCRRDVLLDCELCRAKRTGLLVTSRDFSDVCKYYAGGNGDGHLCLPVIMGGKVGGVVQLVCNGMDQFDKASLERKVAKAQQYVREAQPVLEAKRLMKTLKESSLRDGLTGLYNRRFLEECCEKLIAGIQRRNTTLGLLMCDLDFFKETNDIHGHDVGDMVLKETSSVIRKSVRESDVVVRFGGEEFLVLLMDAAPEAIVASAEKIRAAIEETQVKVAGGVVKKTISIGISEFPGDTQNFWEAIKYADVALYKAKDSGRNRVMRFSSEMWTQERY